jgi:flagellar biosynthesis component FlhA
MIEKIKNFFTGLGGMIVVVLGGAVAVLAYVLSNKRKETNALKAKIDLVETQKHADILEVEIKERMAHKDVLAQEVVELNKGLEALDQKRKTLADGEANKTDKEIEDFWSKK